MEGTVPLAIAPLLTRGDKPTAEARPLKSNFARWAVTCDIAGRPIDSMSEAQNRGGNAVCKETIQPNRRERRRPGSAVIDVGRVIGVVSPELDCCSLATEVRRFTRGAASLSVRSVTRVTAEALRMS
jgi:hypothetical protein